MALGENNLTSKLVIPPDWHSETSNRLNWAQASDIPAVLSDPENHSDKP